VPSPPVISSKVEPNGKPARLKWLAGAAFLAILGGGGATIAGGGTAAVAEVLKDPLSLLADRSPGSRPEGALFSTKRAKEKPFNPVEMVLAGERTRPPVAEEAAPGANLADLMSNPLLAIEPEALPLPFSAPEDAPFGPLGGPSFVGGGAPGPGILIPVGDLPPGGSPGSPPSTGGPGTPPDCCSPGTPPDTTPPVTPAVPEPATWVMLILGFFMVGGSLRASARRAAVQHIA
jgi:hypothetical protein